MGLKRTTKAALKRPWKKRAIEAMARGSTVTEAAALAGVDRGTIYKHLDSDSEFRQAFDDATEQGTDILEKEAQRRAEHGVEEPVIYQGQMTFVGVDANGHLCDPKSSLAVKNIPLTIRKPSDVLMIFLLKGRRPQKFRDNATVEHTGAVGAKLPDLSNLSLDQLRVLRSIHVGHSEPSGN